jgi:hypothetical protein
MFKDVTKMSFLRQASNAVPKSRSWGDDVPKQKQTVYIYFPQVIFNEKAVSGLKHAC